MKKTVKFLSWMFVVMLAAVSFVSCGDDDDKKDGDLGGGGATKSLIGTWKHTFSSGYIIMTFKADGSGSEFEYDSESESWSDVFTYVYDASSGKLLTRYSEEDTEVWDVVFENNNTIYLDGDKYVRQ